MFVVTCKALNEICVRRVQYEWTCLATDLSCLISWHVFVYSSCPIVSWVSLTRKCLSENKQTSCCGCDINGCISKLCLDNIRFSMDYDVRTVVACWVQNYTWLTCVHTPPPPTKTGSTLHITVHVISWGHTTAALSLVLESNMSVFVICGAQSWRGGRQADDSHGRGDCRAQSVLSLFWRTCWCLCSLVLESHMSR